MPWLQLACAVKEAAGSRPCEAASTKAAPGGVQPLGGSCGTAENPAARAPWFEYSCYTAASSESGRDSGWQPSAELPAMPGPSSHPLEPSR